jgi:hypothetical protein
MPLDNNMGPARGNVDRMLCKAADKTNEHNTWIKPNEYNKENLNRNNNDNSNTEKLKEKPSQKTEQQTRVQVTLR